MDTKEKEQLAQQQLDQLKAALKKSKPVENTGAVSGDLDPKDYITLSSTGKYNNSTVIGGGYTVTTSNSTPYYNVGSTSGINWGAGTTSITANPWATTTTAGKLKLEGDDADIEINGVSLLEVLRDRLNVMIPNPALEKEWAELKALGDQYRALEQDLKEKAKIWAELNKSS